MGEIIRIDAKIDCLGCIEDIFNNIATTPGRIDKENILKSHKDNQLFVECLRFLLDTYTVTGISKAKMKKKLNLNLDTYEAMNILDLMDYIKKNNTGKDSDIIVVKKFIENNKDYKEFVEGLITKSTKLGVTAKTVNKIWSGLIKEFNVMLAESYDKNKDKVVGKKFILSTKLDGSRMISIKEGNSVKFFSRQGQAIEGLEEITQDILKLQDGVYDGELIALGEYEDSKLQFSQTMKLSRIKGTKTGLKFVCYDYIENIEDFYNGECNVPCEKRKDMLHEIIDEHLDLQFVEYLHPLYIGDDISMIDEYGKMALEDGQEGIMVSLANSKYLCKRVKSLLKVKAFNECDVRVIDVIEGDNKNKGKLGAIRIQFEHNEEIHECNCGSGFSDEERVKYFENKELLIGKIVTIRYFEVTQNESTKEYGLRFPTWLSIIRDDKDEISMY